MFMTKFPDGTETNFKSKILLGLCVKSGWNMDEEKISPKLHTIRQSNRVKKGMKLSMRYWKDKPYRSPQVEFCKAECLSTQDIKIEWITATSCMVYIDGVFFTGHGITFYSEDALRNKDILAMNDGFNSAADFFDWFNKDFEGQIIHWTNLKY